MAAVIPIPAAEWALVEVMGHARYAGRIEQVTVVGVPMLRVHIPEVVRDWTQNSWNAGEVERDVHETFPAAEIDLGAGSIFRLTRHLTEERVRELVPGCSRPESAPVVRTEGPWRPVVRPALPGPIADAEVVDDIPFDASGEE